MKINKNHLRYTLTIAICTAVTFLLTSAYHTFRRKNSSKTLFTNEEFIKGLFQKVDVTDAEEVFNYVFKQLDKEVTIFPTENYFYFLFSANGKYFKGAISLFARFRDKGNLQFGYIESMDGTTRKKYDCVQGGKIFGVEDGVAIEKLEDYKYLVSYQGKTVCFRMNNIGIDPPQKAKLTPDEEYVGPSFDESGLNFYLLFNKISKKMYWILNEDLFSTETFREYSKDILIGDRTEFAFYADKKNNRKILIAVKGENVLNNNWYDGPFDQMPDNYVANGSVEVKKYLEETYPYHKGKIDVYGNFLSNPEARIPVANYRVYFSQTELSFVDSCKNNSGSDNEFYSRVTQQLFVVPQKYHEAF